MRIDTPTLQFRAALHVLHLALRAPNQERWLHDSAMLSQLALTVAEYYGGSVSARFDIFKIEADFPLWLECVDSLQDCQKRVIELRPEHPKIVIWDNVSRMKFDAAEFLMEAAFQ